MAVVPLGDTVRTDGRLNWVVNILRFGQTRL